MSIFNESNSRKVSRAELQGILNKILKTSVPNNKRNKQYISSTDSYRHLFFANSEQVDFIEFGDLGGYNVEPGHLKCGLLNVQVRSDFDYNFNEITLVSKSLRDTKVDDVIYCKLDIRETKLEKYVRTTNSVVTKYIPLAKKISDDTFLVLNDIPALY